MPFVLPARDVQERVWYERGPALLHVKVANALAGGPVHTHATLPASGGLQARLLAVPGLTPTDARLLEDLPPRFAVCRGEDAACCRCRAFVRSAEVAGRWYHLDFERGVSSVAEAAVRRARRGPPQPLVLVDHAQTGDGDDGS